MANKKLTDAEIVYMLSKGFKVADISNEMGINIRTLDARLVRIREKSKSTTVAPRGGN